MNREKLFASITVHEGFQVDPYKDSKGLWTWLIGRCLETNTLTGPEWKYLLDNKLINVTGGLLAGEYLLGLEVDKHRTFLATFFNNWLSISDARQNVIIEMRYQIKGFPISFPKFCEAVETANWEAAAKEGLDSDWARKDSPARARELMQHLKDDTLGG